MRPAALRVLVVIIAAVTIVLAGAAGTLWRQGDESGSLALATAVATFALSFAAILTIDQNKALIKAASDEASAASEEAKASRETVEEMQRQRELAYRPWLIISRIAAERDGNYVVPRRYRVINIGAGPAVAVVLSAVRKQLDALPTWSWTAAEVQGIEPGGHWDVSGLLIEAGKFEADPNPDRMRCITDDLIIEVQDGEVVAVRYEDLFGVHYRSSPDSRRALRPEEWRGATTTIDAPDWLRCDP